MATSQYLFQREPKSLVDAILQHPPSGFEPCLIEVGKQSFPAFTAEFDLLLTADEPVQRFVGGIGRFLPEKIYSSLLRPRSLFVGTTVSEFALFPEGLDVNRLSQCLLAAMKEQKAKFLIVKDIAPATPFLSLQENALSDQIIEALVAAGFVLLDGQAMAYISIDFDSLDTFFSRFSRSRRSDFRRKLRKRSAVNMQMISTGDPMFQDETIVDEFYQMYENVYNKSYIHFDKLTREFFAQLLTDGQSGGLLFAYSFEDQWIGYSFCFKCGDCLIDKYRGARYPAFRENNLYYLSWFDMLQYAIDHSYKTAIFGWTDPEIKAYLGADFVFTKHAVYPANFLLRKLLGSVADAFESDRKTLSNWYASHEKIQK